MCPCPLAMMLLHNAILCISVIYLYLIINLLKVVSDILPVISYNSTPLFAGCSGNISGLVKIHFYQFQHNYGNNWPGPLVVVGWSLVIYVRVQPVVHHRSARSTSQINVYGLKCSRPPYFLWKHSKSLKNFHVLNFLFDLCWW